ncbi:MAG TPA: MarR family transcriptional regulator [Candidatus Angelobacter sp.]|nr:MarR family transcriptional regulator [Candidatus Angelobacter sp.]
MTHYMGLRGREGEAVISRLLRASIGLQKAFDRCFAHAGLTAQEAAVLVHCAEAKELSAGKLAQAMGRDKGKITRFIDRLEAGGFVRRVSDPRDHRLLIIKPTVRGQRAAPTLKRTFEQVREEFLSGIQSDDLNRLGSVLSALHENAGRLYKGRVSNHPPKNTRD